MLPEGQGSPLCSSLCLWLLVLALSTAEKSLALPAPFLQVFIDINECTMLALAHTQG